MKTQILNGTKYQNEMMLKIGTDVAQLTNKYGEKPGIAFIAMVGHEPLLKYTIDLHVRTAEQLGFEVLLKTLPHTSEESEIIKIISKLNTDDSIQSIVVLQPLPVNISSINVTLAIDPIKEVEGFHPVNMMETAIKGIHNSRYPMALPASLYELFKGEEIEIKDGSEFVFLMDDYFFENPFTRLVATTAANAVVPETCSIRMVNTADEEISKYVGKTDFLVVISKKPEFLNPVWLKKGVCIIDIYSNLIREVQSKKDPTRLVPVIRGGVNVESVQGIAGAIAPCPGGIMQILLGVLFRNSIIAFEVAKQAKAA